MNLGEKIKQARIERKLTQKEVVGNHITRNMLSKIENGSATPSIKTLEYLASRLGLPSGYFLNDLPDRGEDTLYGLSGARSAYADGSFSWALELLNSRNFNVAGSGDEYALLRARCYAQLARDNLYMGDKTAARSMAESGLEAVGSGLYSDVESECLCLEVLMRIALDDEDDLRFNEYSMRFDKASSMNGLFERNRLIHAIHDNNKDMLSSYKPDDLWARAAQLYLQAQKRLANNDTPGAETLLLEASSTASKVRDSSLLKHIYISLEEIYKSLGDYRGAYEYASLRLELKID